MADRTFHIAPTISSDTLCDTRAADVRYPDGVMIAPTPDEMKREGYAPHWCHDCAEAWDATPNKRYPALIG